MKAKGAGWLATYAYFAKNFSPVDLEKVKAALSVQDRSELFDRTILPVSWIDEAAYMNFVLTADRILGKGDKKLIREAAIHCARENFRGIYKFFISLTSPRFILSNADKVWRQYYDSGNVEVEWLADKHCVFKLTGVPDIPPHHEWDQIPTLEEAVRISGGKNVCIVHSKCMARKDALCLFDIKWE